MSDAKPVHPETFPCLNAMRAVGAMMVLTTHTAFDTGQIMVGWTGALLARMDFGVTIFFVLSGFLLSRPFLQHAIRRQPAPSTQHYLWKRFLRVMPLYWLVVLWAMLFEPENDGVITDGMWLRNFTLTQLYRNDLLPTGLTQMWSLATEAAFYVTLPLLMWLLIGPRRKFSERRILIGLAVISVLGIAWQAWASTQPGGNGHFAQWLPGYLPWFAAGIAFATVSVTDVEHMARTGVQRQHLFHRWGSDLPTCWIVATLVFLIACTPISGSRNLLVPLAWEAGTKDLLYTISGAFLILPLVFGDQSQGAIRKISQHKIPHYLGEISYGIFCIHVLVMKAIFRATEIQIFSGQWLQIWFLTTAITIVLSALAYHFIERPFLQLKNRGPFVPRRKRADPPASSADQPASPTSPVGSAS